MSCLMFLFFFTIIILAPISVTTSIPSNDSSAEGYGGLEGNKNITFLSALKKQLYHITCLLSIFFCRLDI